MMRIFSGRAREGGEGERRGEERRGEEGRRGDSWIGKEHWRSNA